MPGSPARSGCRLARSSASTSTRCATRRAAGGRASPRRREAAARAMSNVDPAELEKFSQLAHRWWDPSGESLPLHDLNPVRLRYVAERVTLRGAAVLDVGCGGGLLSEALAREGARVTGIDLGAAVLEVARMHLHESGL